FVFFFQAEDGIRDDLVTGVQTCALPISEGGVGSTGRDAGDTEVGPPVARGVEARREVPERLVVRLAERVEGLTGDVVVDVPVGRSEERRVGKEWESGAAPGQEKEAENNG